MSQTQIQEQKLEQRLGQSISQQQLLQSQLVELPLTQLLDRIATEMDDNPALEARVQGDPDTASTVGDAFAANPADSDYSDADFPVGDGSAVATDDYDSQREREDRQSALDAALAQIGRDDEDLPVYPPLASHLSPLTSDYDEPGEMAWGETASFYDLLKEQMNLADISERQRDIMEYLIGSLDDDGLLRKSLSQLSDELAIYHNIDAQTDEIEEVLARLQEFDPPGIGARSLQECLLLQIERRDDSTLKSLMQQTISLYFDEFTKKHWQRIQAALHLTDLQATTLIKELRKLNPKPGSSLGETAGRSLQQITPDFIVETHEDGTVTFSLNSADIPELQVSQSFADSIKQYRQAPESISRQDKEALLYIKKKVDAAQSFIQAISMRRRTLTLTMQAIISLQRQFFIDGDEASLRPMILKDVASKTGLDLSTISRVSNSKYVQTSWGTFPLRHFFSESYVTPDGEELSTRQIKAALADIIGAEDKRHPLSDEALTAALAKRGFPIARRTVAKYREQLSLPVARLRKHS